MRYYSCDSHVVEAREVFEGLEARFGDRAPRIERDHAGRPGDWLMLPSATPHRALDGVMLVGPRA